MSMRCSSLFSTYYSVLLGRESNVHQRMFCVISTVCKYTVSAPKWVLDVFLTSCFSQIWWTSGQLHVTTLWDKISGKCNSEHLHVSCGFLLLKPNLTSFTQKNLIKKDNWILLTFSEIVIYKLHTLVFFPACPKYNFDQPCSIKITSNTNRCLCYILYIISVINIKGKPGKVKW